MEAKSRGLGDSHTIGSLRYLPFLFIAEFLLASICYPHLASSIETLTNVGFRFALGSAESAFRRHSGER